MSPKVPASNAKPAGAACTPIIVGESPGRCRGSREASHEREKAPTSARVTKG